MTLTDRNFIFPDEILHQQSQHPLLKSLYLCRAGRYSSKNKSINHRPNGFQQANILIYCTDGNGWYESLGQRWTISKGELFFAKRNIPHIYGPAEVDSWGGYGIYFNGEEAEAYLKWLGVTPQAPVLNVGKQHQLTRLFDEVLSFCQLGYSSNYLVNSAGLLRQILSRIKLNQHKMFQKSQGFEIERSIQFMLDHLADKITVQQMAADANLSETYFAKEFQKGTGYAPIDYFIRLKMQKACDLLSTTNLRVQEIGLELGYTDPYYFSRSFKKVLGLSPQKYRHSNQFIF